MGVAVAWARDHVNGYALAALGWDDLLAAARLGVCYAAESYDPTKGAAFSTWAYWKIRSEVQYACKAATGCRTGHRREVNLSPSMEAETDSRTPMHSLGKDDHIGAVDSRDAAALLRAVAIGRERDVIDQFLAGCETGTEVAESLGITRERVRQLVNRLRQRVFRYSLTEALLA